MTPIRAMLLVALVAAIAFALGLQEGINRPPPQYWTARPVMVDDPDELPPVARQVFDAMMTHDPLQRAVTLGTLFQKLGREDIPQVQQAFDSIFVDRHPIDTLLYAHWLAPLDPDGALEWVRRENSELNGPAVLEAMARVDAQRAVVLAEQIAFGAYQQLALDALVRGWDESGQPGLPEYLGSMPASFKRARRIQTALRRRLLGEGIDSAIRWVEEIPDVSYNFKLDVHRQLVTQLARIDIDRAAAFASDKHLGPYGSNLAQRLTTHWSYSNPEASMAWASTLPPSKERDRAVSSGYLVWLQRSKDEATRWMDERFDSVGEAEWLQPAAALYLGRLAKTGSPAAQLARMPALTRKDVRERAISDIVVLWLRSEREAAEAWLDESPLSEELIAQIRAREKQFSPPASPEKGGKKAADAKGGEPG